MNSKTLLITGASSDIGVALIRRIAQDYRKIVCHYRNSAAAVETLKTQFGDKIVLLRADFADEKSSDNFINRMFEQDIAPSHFVHLPAIPNVNAKFSKTQWADFEKHMAVELHSAYIICRAIIPFMTKNRYGKIVFMLTENVAKNIPGRYAVPYTTAKYALLGLMKCLASEYADRGITVNGVSPSMIETAFISHLPEITCQLNAEKNPLKRNLTVDDVTPTLAYLLSSAADVITGQNLSIGVGV